MSLSKGFKLLIISYYLITCVDFLIKYDCRKNSVNVISSLGFPISPCLCSATLNTLPIQCPVLLISIWQQTFAFSHHRYLVSQKARKSPTISVVKVYYKGLTSINYTMQDIPRDVCCKERKLTEIILFKMSLFSKQDPLFVYPCSCEQWL